MDRLKTQMSALEIGKKKIGREYFCEHREINCFLREMSWEQIIKEKVDFLF